MSVTSTNGYSCRKKFLLFAAISVLLFVSCLSYTHPNAFLPVHNAQRNTSLEVTGVTLGAGHVGLIFSTLVAPWLLNKYSSRCILLVSSVGLSCQLLTFSALHYTPAEYDALYGIASVGSRLVGGTFGGVLEVLCFAALLSIYPNQVGLVTSVAESVLNSSLAFAPFLGSVLYTAGGFTLAFLVPGALMACTVLPCAASSQLTSRDAEGGETHSGARLLDPLLLFPLWHLASSQVLQHFHTPLLALYVEEAFGEDIIWTGLVLTLNTFCIVLSSPFCGLLIDRYNPYIPFFTSSLLLPLSYIFVGPVPFLGLASSKLLLILSLSALGVTVPMACVSALPVMYDVYSLQNGGEMPARVRNTLVSLYCAAYPCGIFLGLILSTSIAPHLGFRWSTGAVALGYLVEAVLCAGYVCKIVQMKRNSCNENKTQNSHALVAANG